MGELFEEEELLKLEENSLFSDSPVTVLGKEFKNDAERKEYFREELRKKLPELKKLEGYPIGEDEDILNLSDPPFYTACPNPWLNDFIAEWENEKKELEKKGKRKEKFEVNEPYASDVSEGKNNPIYNAHSYHTKVPHPAIMRYILHYTQPGDIILDGFAGTGMTGVAAQLCENPDIDLKNKIEGEFERLEYPSPIWGKRHAICNDLSSVASFIAYNYNTPVNAKEFKLKSNKLIDSIEKQYGWMYETKHSDGSIGKINYVVWSDVFICPNCGNEIIFYDVAVDKTTDKVKKDFSCPTCGTKHTKKDLEKKMLTVFDKDLNKSIKISKTIPVLIQYFDEYGKKHNKKPDDEDYSLIKKINEIESKEWYPKERTPEGKETRRNDSSGITNVHQFYTKRNLLLLAIIKENCTTALENLLFNSQLINLSKLNRYRPGISFPYNPLSGTLYIGSQVSESNVFIAYRNKINRITEAIQLLSQRNLTSISSAENLNLKDNSIDYIFTDPPFGANINYSELNFIQECWLKIKTNNKDEAIENERQHKSLADYQFIMQNCFKEYYRVLKSGHWITIEFSNTSASVWNAILLALNKAGFIVSNIAALDKQQGSFKAVTTPTAVKQDLVISCYKPSENFTKKFIIQDGNLNIWEFIKEHLAHLPIPFIKDNKSTAVIERSPKVLYDRLITYFLMRGLSVPIDAADFQQGLRTRYILEDGMIFNTSQLTEYHELKKKYNIPDQQSLFVEIIENENDAIQWLKEKLEEKPLKYQDIQPEYRKAYTISKKGELEVELKEVLEENFIQEEDGSWRIPDLNEQKDREALRTKSLLKIWNEYCTQVDSGKVKKLKDVRLEAIKAGFKDCYKNKDFKRIVDIGNKIPENLLTEDETLLNYYDIASNKI